MIGNRNSGRLQWTHANIKPLTVTVGGPCLGPPKPDVPGRGGAQGPALAPRGRAALMGVSSLSQRASHEPYARPEEQVLINRRDIMSTKVRRLGRPPPATRGPTVTLSSCALGATGRHNNSAPSSF